MFILYPQQPFLGIIRKLNRSTRLLAISHFAHALIPESHIVMLVSGGNHVPFSVIGETPDIPVRLMHFGHVEQQIKPAGLNVAFGIAERYGSTQSVKFPFVRHTIRSG